MKKKALSLCLGLCSLLTLALVSCGSGSGAKTNEGSSLSQRSLRLSRAEAAMLYGDSLELFATLPEGESGEVAWSSSDPAVCTVEEGTVKAVGQGDCEILAAFADLTASCRVSVSFGDFLPSLSLIGIPEEGVSLAQGSDFLVEAKALFRGASYECDYTLASSDSGVFSVEGKRVKAVSSGGATLTVTGTWKGYSGGLMEQSVPVKVLASSTIVPEITLNGETKVTNDFSLSLVPSWQGVSYATSAGIRVLVEEEGVSHEASILLEDDGVLSYADGVLSAEKAGATTVRASYTREDGTSIGTSIAVTVICPKAEYPVTLSYETASPFPVEDIFGAGAKITKAIQDGVPLSFDEEGYLDGVIAKGSDTPGLTIETTNGGFHFASVFAYTRGITADNFLDVFRLSEGKIVDGYYLLLEDIGSDDSPLDVTGQGASRYAAGSNDNAYFSGVFDGNGHTLYLKTGHEGAFGGFGDGALIKDAHFVFTFGSASAALPCSGLARNNHTFIQNKWTATLSNLFVETTNSAENDYAISEMRFLHLVMNDVYVKLSGWESLSDFTSTSLERGALFRTDVTMTSGPYGSFNGEFRNVQVVTGKFGPIANGIWQGLYTYTCYARNDVGRLGSITHHAPLSSSTNYCVILPADGREDLDLFGYVPSAEWLSDTGYLCWAYYASGTIENGGVHRYDTAGELIASGVEKVGTWEVR